MTTPLSAAAHPSLLPAAERYFRLVQEPDPAAPLPAFAPDAWVRDDGRDYRGHAEIRAWLTGQAAAFAFTTTRLSVESTAATAVVRLRVAGNFPGGVVELRYNFTANAAGLLSGLTITAI